MGFLLLVCALSWLYVFSLFCMWFIWAACCLFMLYVVMAYGVSMHVVCLGCMWTVFAEVVPLCCKWSLLAVYGLSLLYVVFLGCMWSVLAICVLS